MNNHPRRSCLGLGLEAVSELTGHVPEAEYIEISSAAARTPGDFDAKRKALFTRLTPHALDGLRRAREHRVRARAIATNAAACRRIRGVRRTRAGRARRTRVVRAAGNRAGPSSDPDGESPPPITTARPSWSAW